MDHGEDPGPSAGTAAFPAGSAAEAPVAMGTGLPPLPAAQPWRSRRPSR